MILVTSVLVSDEIEKAIDNDITISVSDIENILEIDEIAKRKEKIANIHIKLDTGMTRLGFSKDNIIINFSKIQKLQYININGIYTHLSCADSDEEYTLNQINEFKDIVKELSKNYNFKYIHILNSDGVEYYTDKTDMDTHVRIGISMYGYTKNTKPITKLTAPVIHINTIDKYTKVGYGGTFIAKPNTKIAVLKIGYADGISRNLSNKLKVKVNGVVCQQIGNICMDLMMIDVTNVHDIKINDEAILWDYNDDLKEIAKISGKIVYEVISNLGNRIERIVE
jgi:alanine racemase